MTPHRLLPVLTALLVLPACSEVRDTADRTADCVGLARDVAASGLSRTPSLEEAEAAVRRLDERVASLDEGEVRDAATTLRDRLDALVRAARSGDTVAASQAAEDARTAARDAAETCGVPVDQFLG